MSDVNCPYCNAELEINHDDGYGYDEDEMHKQQCSNCRNHFAYETTIIINYEAHQAPCFNDGEHTARKIRRYGRDCVWLVMECEYCGIEISKVRIGDKGGAE